MEPTIRTLRRSFVRILGVLLVVTLGGCLIPEQFDAKVTIASDGSYNYSYDGILTFAPALADANRGVLDARGENETAKLAPQLKREGFSKADYLGKGRFAVSYARQVPKGQPSVFISQDLKLFYIAPASNGTIDIGAFRPSPSEVQQLAAIGAKIDGTLSVSLPRSAKVLKHNAQSEPSLYGFLGSYKWEIKSTDSNPFLTVQLSQ